MPKTALFVALMWWNEIVTIETNHERTTTPAFDCL
jgi:hypothetical protein